MQVEAVDGLNWVHSCLIPFLIFCAHQWSRTTGRGLNTVEEQLHKLYMSTRDDESILYTHIVLSYQVSFFANPNVPNKSEQLQERLSLISILWLLTYLPSTGYYLDPRIELNTEQDSPSKQYFVNIQQLKRPKKLCIEIYLAVWYWSRSFLPFRWSTKQRIPLKYWTEQNKRQWQQKWH